MKFYVFMRHLGERPGVFFKFSQVLYVYMYIYASDALKIVRLQGKEANAAVKQLESDITFHIGKQEAELALRVNSAAYHGDLHQLKDLIRAGADLNKTDYDGRSPLVCFRIKKRSLQLFYSFRYWLL